MKKIPLISFFTFICIVFDTVSAKPAYPGEVIARNLDSRILGWAGHVGITTADYMWLDADQVIEVLNEHPVIQTNYLSDFKTRTPYWGSRWGIADRGDNGLMVLRTANWQKDMGCGSYTIFNFYIPNVGYYDSMGHPHAVQCGYFRCDTFVNFAFSKGGYFLPTYNPPGSNNVKHDTDPKLVFYAFPYGNGDGPYSLTNPTSSEVPSAVMTSNVKNHPILSIRSLSAKQLTDMPSDEFAAFLQRSSGRITDKDAHIILAWAKDSTLSAEKRTYLMDLLGFVGTADMIPQLIGLYHQLDKSDDKVKQQLISTTQNLRQRLFHDEDHSKEKDQLLKFYSDLLNHPLSRDEADTVIRGFLALSSKEEVIAHLDKINTILNDRTVDMHPRIALGLKIELMHEHHELDTVYIPDIIAMLHRENNPELDGVFNTYLIERLSHSDTVSKELKNQVSAYLASVSYKYDQHDRKHVERGVSMFSFGAWLEATALVNTNSLKEAGKYVAKYIQGQNPANQESYIIGLTNSPYMLEAFETEPTLVAFKKKHLNLYLNTVGAPPISDAYRLKNMGG